VVGWNNLLTVVVTCAASCGAPATVQLPLP